MGKSKIPNATSTSTSSTMMIWKCAKECQNIIYESVVGQCCELVLLCVLARNVDCINANSPRRSPVVIYVEVSKFFAYRSLCESRRFMKSAATPKKSLNKKRVCGWTSFWVFRKNNGGIMSLRYASALFADSKNVTINFTRWPWSFLTFWFKCNKTARFIIKSWGVRSARQLFN